MPRIFDNIEQHLSQGLQQVMGDAVACSFCVGYLNLRGWDQLADSWIASREGAKSAHADCWWACIAPLKRR
jgi:hypothetical protein